MVFFASFSDSSILTSLLLMETCASSSSLASHPYLLEILVEEETERRNQHPGNLE
jgi:hypothetical protein